MQYDNNDMDKKLRQLEHQSLPDLSQQDQHWQQMKTMLQPGAPAVKPGTGKKSLLWGAIAALLLGGLAVLIIKLSREGKKGNIAGQQQIVSPVITRDTVPSQTIMIRKDSIIIKQQPVKITAPVRFPLKKSVIRIDTIQNIILTDVVQTPPVDPKASLEDFFEELKKETQEFVINNSRDTILLGKEGTALLIPARTFSSKESVTIVMKEYYSYQDIITNRLNTTSNGQQLVTGGMLHLMATVNGKEVAIQPGKSIRWFVPDTSAVMKEMQLFAGQPGTQRSSRLVYDGDGPLDSVRDGLSPLSFNGINWIAQPSYFTGDYLFTSAKVLDIRNEPLKTRQTKNGLVGVFYLSSDPKISKEELETTMKEKYGYSRVKIKKKKSDRGLTNFFPMLFGKKLQNQNMDIGDSAWVDINVARTYRLNITDTMVSRMPRIGRYDFDNDPKGRQIRDALFNNASLNSLAERFSVDIRTMGWINCDRFYNQGPRIDYYVDINDTASNYNTFLVFTGIRSMMTGYVSGNKVLFRNVPQGENAKVISVGIQNGKPVAAMEDVQLSKDTLSNLRFGETTPASFKEQAGILDK
jgi:hypothetical protein